MGSTGVNLHGFYTFMPEKGYPSFTGSALAGKNAKEKMSLRNVVNRRIMATMQDETIITTSKIGQRLDAIVKHEQVSYLMFDNGKIPR
jgi:hypothetical protein